MLKVDKKNIKSKFGKHPFSEINKGLLELNCQSKLSYLCGVDPRCK
jgi:hypothetical protein